MLEAMVLLLFVIGLIGCIISGASILWALAAGYMLFFVYGLIQHHTVWEMLSMSWSGVRTVGNILMIFALIGCITALWRVSGTIAVIICYASKIVSPSAFLLIAFLLNCLVSVLTGTSFGTGATMGVICMSIGQAMGLDPLWLGGAILSGIFFGDRCSPVSSSANLVCTLTKTDIYENIRKMIRTSVIPFAVTCAIYFISGCLMRTTNSQMDVEALFQKEFVLHWVAVLPACLILVLAVFHVGVKKTMLVSIFTAAVIAALVQNRHPVELIQMCLGGYTAKDAAVGAMMDGGGLKSMIRVTLIVSLSSCYSGIFKGTGLLTPIQEKIRTLGQKIGAFGTTCLVSVITSMIACNQTLAILLTNQLCEETEPDHEKFAIDLENTVVVLAPLIPWSIAGAVPLAVVGAPGLSVVVACYLYLLPAWNWWRNRVRK